MGLFFVAVKMLANQLSIFIPILIGIALTHNYIPPHIMDISECSTTSITIILAIAIISLYTNFYARKMHHCR